MFAPLTIGLRKGRPIKTKGGTESVIQTEFVQFIRAAAAPALGRVENLDRQIQEALRRGAFDEQIERWLRVNPFI